MPLIRYIRKQKAQEKRKRDGSVVTGFTSRTRETAGKGTTWTYAGSGSEEEMEEGQGGASKFGGRSQATRRSNGTAGPRKKSKRLIQGGDEMMDLLDPQQVVKMNAGRHDEDREEDEDDPSASSGGRGTG